MNSRLKFESSYPRLTGFNFLKTKTFSLGSPKKYKHILIWVLISIYLDLIDPVPGPIKAHLIGLLLIILSYVFVYYFLYLLAFPFFLNGGILALLPLTLIGFFIYLAIDRITFYTIIPSLGGASRVQQMSLYQLAMIDLVSYSIVGTTAIASFANNLAIQKLKAQDEQQKSLMRKELSFLKSQFHSHITFNFLNYCYSQVHEKSSNAAEAIERFSDMLRYSLHVKPDEDVELAREVEYIHNFIHLQRKLGSQVHADFLVEGDLSNKRILPRVLITFVENAFKHGVCNDPDNPIRIRLTIDSQKIHFSVHNKINTNKIKQISGIGEGNAIGVLNLFYSDRYSLRTGPDGTSFLAALTLYI
jgi:two-component system LytT family sensor kinase